LLSTLACDSPEEISYHRGRDRNLFQACRYDNFSLVVGERRSCTDDVDYTKLDGYIKINFWLGGRHTTVLDGFGQHEHDRPDLFIVSTPQDAIKVDLYNQDTLVSAVALCVLPEFFPTHMGLSVDELPEPLRAIAAPDERPFAFCRFPLTQELAGAARAVLSVPFTIRRDPVYAQAKCVELMCLLIHVLARNQDPRASETLASRHERRLYEAREMLGRRYSEPLTLEQIAKEVGLNRLALSSGFRQLFGLSVYDHLQKQRMQRAYELLQDAQNTVSSVAQAVGFSHPSNFSTAFHAYFGCTPRQARSPRR
jgi:AraC-like DNA-binding protein